MILTVEDYSYIDKHGVKEVGTIIQGEKDGYWLSFDTSSSLIKEEKEYKNGKLDGCWKSYFKDGGVQIISNWTNDTLNGLYQAYYLPQSIAEKGNYVMGKKIGRWYYYINREQDEKSDLAFIVDYYRDDTVLVFDKQLIPPLPDGTPEWKKY